MLNTNLPSALHRQHAVDLGSSTLRLSQPPHESVLSEPNILVRNKRSGNIVAACQEADKLRGRTPAHYTFIEPVQNEVVADPDAAITLLSRIGFRYRSWLESVIGQKFLVGVSPNATDTDLRTVADVFERVGSRSTEVAPTPLAALVGAGVAVNDPFAQMVIDIGSDITSAGIVAQKQLIASKSIPVAGRSLDQAVKGYMENERNLHISFLQAEEIKHRLAAVNDAQPKQQSMTVYGQDTASRLPRETSVSTTDISKAIQPTIDQITSAIQNFLQSVSADVAADVYTHGVHLVGGTTQLPGLVDELAESLSISVYEHDDPEEVVIRGLGIISGENRGYTQQITKFTDNARTE
jgi:rod shape-determining protein MreB